MFNLFSKQTGEKNSQPAAPANSLSTPVTGFEYLSADDYYFDSACQTLRPQPVIDAMNEYYTQFNSCGHRVSYPWGETLDKKIDQTRESILKFTGKTSKDYIVAFTLNTTYGINLILSQLDYQGAGIQSVITSEIEHNSVFLPTIIQSKQNKLPRIVLERDMDGTVKYEKDQLKNALVLLNSTSNIDGRNLINIKELQNDIHDTGGLLLLDACQTLGHSPQLVRDVEFDALFGSGHKMYGPSIGFMVIKRTLLEKLNPTFIGGGTVEAVSLDTYTLVSDKEEAYSILEPGLQHYAGIVGLGAAIEWRQKISIDGMSAREYESKLAEHLYNKLSKISNIDVFNDGPASAISIIPKKISGHQLGLYLGQAGFMVRTGYHCCHYYLKEKLSLPPTLRISLGLHNSEAQIDKICERIDSIIN